VKKLASYRPKFRTDLIASDYQESSGRKSVVLKDPVAEKYYRLSQYELALLKAFDGTVTVDQALARLHSQGRYYPPEEALQIVNKVAQCGLMLGTPFSSAEVLTPYKKGMKKAGNLRKLSSVYYMYLPLLNPDRFLEKTLPIFKILVNKYTAAVMALLGMGALYLIVAGLPRMQEEYLYFFNWENMLYLSLVTTLIKVIHEFGHAFAAKSFGLHVPRMGIAFLLFFPCMYCDTTDAWKLADRKQRMAIGAAGILTELTLAIIATYIWYFSQAGIVNSLAFYLLVISTVSTVLFNGNPLMKFDGYFILMDYLRKPNLASRSSAYVKYLFMNRVLGLSEVANPARSSEENVLLSAYGVSAFIYRFFLYFGIVVGIYSRFDKLLGIVLAFVALGLFVLRPMIMGTLNLWRKRKDFKLKLKESLVFVAVVGAAVVLLAWPWSSKSIFPCYMESARTQKLAVPFQATITDVYIRQGMAVEQDALLMRLEPYNLQLELVRKKIDREVIRNTLWLTRVDDKEKGRAGGQELELTRAEAGVQKIEQDLDMALHGVKAPFAGVVTGLDPRVQAGFMPGRGIILGELKSSRECVAYALVPGMHLHKIRQGQLVDIWFPVNGGTTFSKRIDSVRSYNERNLTDSPFSSRFGGEIATEAEGHFASDVPLEDLYVCSVHFPDNRTIPLGLTGRLVVSSPPESTLERIFHHAVQTINKESLL
jgi:putative peptide zinc metalloprotease protein